MQRTQTNRQEKSRVATAATASRIASASRAHTAVRSNLETTSSATSLAMSSPPAPVSIHSQCVHHNTSAAREAGDLFQCREQAAQLYARSMCHHLNATPPNPPFQRASLNIAQPASSVNAATESEGQGSIPIFVEASNDFVSESIIERGALASLV